MRDAKTDRISFCAVVAAIYAVLTIALAPISYGAVQCRVSEVLCILPYFFPASAWGLFLGCFAANLITGNMFDIIFGSLATLLAALLTGAIGKRRHSFGSAAAACFMPVLFNALIIGAVITAAYENMDIIDHLPVFAANALWVGAGELAVMYVLGLPLMLTLPRKKFFADAVKRFG